MEIVTAPFTIAGKSMPSLHISISGQLTNSQTNELRAEIQRCLSMPFTEFYLDTAAVTDMDLSGMNELIYTHHSMIAAGKNLVLAYQSDSPVETWIIRTGAQKFMVTAIIPAV